MKQKAAFVLGASGSVGKVLVAELIRSKAFAPIVNFGRKAQGTSGIKEVLLEMTSEKLEEALLREALCLDVEIVGFSVLGVGANTASLSIDEHRAVDVQLNQAFARALQKSGKVKHLNFMSAVGANSSAKTTGPGGAGFARYNRVKGESEDAVKAQSLEIVSIFRPAMIIGSVHTPSLMEKIIPLFSFVTPKNFLAISTQEIAQSMVAAALKKPSSSEVYHYPEMIALIKGNTNCIK